MAFTRGESEEGKGWEEPSNEEKKEDEGRGEEEDRGRRDFRGIMGRAIGGKLTEIVQNEDTG